MLPYNLFGRVSCVVGKYGDAAAMLGKGIPLAEAYQDWELLAGSLAFYGLALAMHGDRPAGQHYFDRATTLAEQLGLPSRIAANFMVNGYAYTMMGRFEEASQILRHCLEIATPRHDLHPMYIAHGSLGYLYLYQGNPRLAWEHLETCMGLAASPAAGGAQLPLYLGFRAFWLELSARRRSLLEVLKEGEELLAAAQKTQQVLGQAFLEQTMSKLLAAAPRPDWQKAEDHLRRSLELFRFGKGHVHEAVARLHLADLYARQGKSETALQFVRQCRAEFGRFGMSDFQDKADWLQEQIQRGEQNFASNFTS